MKKILTFFSFIILCSTMGLAQEAFHNFGNIKNHNATSMGFHLDLVNDGVFRENTGLVGFYGYDKSLSISGTNIPEFYDSEVLVEDDLYIDVAVDIVNNLNLITGLIITPRNDQSIYMNFINDAYYNGQNNAAKVDGYAAMMNKESFTFPIGDNGRLRTLRIESEAINASTLCAYFFEDPNNASTFNQGFDTNITGSNIFQTSTNEFWHLESDMPSKVTIPWDNHSEINTLATSLTDLKIVGWNTALQHWEDLGNTAVNGNFNNGTLTSDTFVPSDYDIITFAGNERKLNTYNYYVSPDGDGVDDVLIIEGMEESKDNNLSLYSRWGRLVFSKDNYTNEFGGFSNRNHIVNKSKTLPSGVYFYIVTLNDFKQKHQGYIYLATNEKN